MLNVSFGFQITEFIIKCDAYPASIYGRRVWNSVHYSGSGRAVAAHLIMRSLAVVQLSLNYAPTSHLTRRPTLIWMGLFVPAIRLKTH